jgi:Ras association domain-containing protein 1
MGMTFQGFIRVHMNLIRPINMAVSARPPSIYDVLTHGEPEDDSAEPPGPEVEEITSFYLPKDTTKVIHIDSHTTAQEVIRALLAKFKITDNPRKFALYEKPIGMKAGESISHFAHQTLLIWFILQVRCEG